MRLNRNSKRIAIDSQLPYGTAVKGMLMVRFSLTAVALVLACPAYAQDDSPGDANGDEEIIVTARAAKLYRVEQTASGKMPTEPLASSQTISVITEQLIEDQGARDAQDLYRNLSGVSFFSYAGVTARGFRQEENFYDGLRGDPYIGFAVPQLFNVGRVEFLKGPAGMLYGQTAPGGLFNYVTKKPSEMFEAEGKIVFGTEARHGGQLEVSGPVGDVVALRGAAFYESRDLPRTWAGNRTLMLDGGAAFDLGPVKLTTQALLIEQDLAANRLRGIPVDDEGHFLADREWNHNEPSDFLDLRSTSFYARLDAQPVDGLTLDIAARRIDSNETQNYHEPFLVDAAGNVFDTDGDGEPDGISRQFRDQFRDSGIWSVGGNAVWSAQLSDTVSNRVLAGFDYSTEEAFSRSATLRGRATPAAGLPCPLAFDDPVYNACHSSTYNVPAPSRSLTETERYGFYALNELTVGPLIAVAGIRTDTFDDTSTNLVNGTVSGFQGGDETYRLGLVWRARDEVSLFAQYATSFEPQSASAQDPRAGGPFAPTTGNMLEGGIKTALFGGGLQSTVAVYRIVRENLLQADPRGDPEGDGIDNSIAFGEVTSKGVDVDIAADLTDHWVLTLAYGYNDTRITGDNGGGGFSNAVGDRFANAPRHQLGFWTRYQIPEVGLAFALGGDYVSKRVSLSDQPVNPYMVFDASITWTTGPMELRLRVDNLFDKTYAASGFNDRGGHFPGEPRSAFVEAGYRF